MTVALATTQNTSRSFGNPSMGYAATAGDGILVFVNAVGNTNLAPTCKDDSGGTYTLIGTAQYNTNGSTSSLFQRDQPVLVSGTITITVTTGSSTSSGFCVAPLRGWGKWSSAIIKQFGTQANGAAAGTPAPALGVAASGTNLVLSFIANLSNPAGVTDPSGFSRAQNTGNATGPLGMELDWQETGVNFNTVTWGGTSATAFAAWVVEIDGTPAAFNPNVGPSGAGPSGGRRRPRSRTLTERFRMALLRPHGLIQRFPKLLTPDVGIRKSVAVTRYGELAAQWIERAPQLIDEQSYKTWSTGTSSIGLLLTHANPIPLTTPSIVIFNQENDPKGRSIYLDEINLTVTGTGLNITNPQVLVGIDDDVFISAGGTVQLITPVSNLGQGSVAKIVTGQNITTAHKTAAGAFTPSLVSSNRFLDMTASVVQGSTYSLQFGRSEGHLGGQIGGGLTSAVIHLPPVIIGPKTAALVYLWSTSVTTAPTFRVDAAWWER